MSKKMVYFEVQSYEHRLSLSVIVNLLFTALNRKLLWHVCSVLQLRGGGDVPLLLEHKLLLHQVSAGALACRAQANVSTQTQLIPTVSGVQDWCRCSATADVADCVGGAGKVEHVQLYILQ